MGCLIMGISPARPPYEQCLCLCCVVCDEGASRQRPRAYTYMYAVDALFCDDCPWKWRWKWKHKQVLDFLTARDLSEGVSRLCILPATAPCESAPWGRANSDVFLQRPARSTCVVHAAFPISIFLRMLLLPWNMTPSISPVTVKIPPMIAHSCVRKEERLFRSSCTTTCIGEIS